MASSLSNTSTAGEQQQGQGQLLTGHLNATRFAQKPIPQPTYSFANVPKAQKNLKGSVVQIVTKREDFQWCMGEMLLVCKEATRRHPTQKLIAGSKPLSLEYLADRLDIDDPCFGYLIRTNEKIDSENNNNNNKGWKKGMLQGFITVTTFTNWQKSFEWDSLNPAAYEDEDDDNNNNNNDKKNKDKDNNRITNNNNNEQQPNRVVDKDGSLSKALQSTVRYGDIWNEGIVWPRIAEISLLGAIGCGRALVSLVIEDLEAMKPTLKANYDYIALQATDNSINFYESLGFVRVGTVMKDDTIQQQKQQEAANNGNNQSEIVTGPITTYKVYKSGEYLKDIARKYKVDVWDIQFLNPHLGENLTASTRFLKGTTLYVPVILSKDDNKEKTDKKNKVTTTTGDGNNNNNNEHGPTSESTSSSTTNTGPTWHIAKENDTPRTIARKYKVNCVDIVEANKKRLPGLVSSSRLKAGTKVKVSHLDVPDSEYRPYSHWSFPDDEFEDGEPSYMMVRKLNKHRKKSKLYTTTTTTTTTTSSEHPFRDSLAAPFEPYTKTDLLLLPTFPDSPKTPVPTAPAAAAPTTLSVVPPSDSQAATSTESGDQISNNSPSFPYPNQASVVRVGATGTLPAEPNHPNMTITPIEPPIPKSPYMILSDELRELAVGELDNYSVGEMSKLVGELWRDLPDIIKAMYTKLSNESKVEYKKWQEAVAALEKQQQQQQSANTTSNANETTSTSITSNNNYSNRLPPVPENMPSGENGNAAPVAPTSSSKLSVAGEPELFNTVVRLREGAIAEASDYKYWYVLTYIPDLRWCHLAPMIQVGVFGDDKPRAKGRPKWKLVDEALGHEVDISSNFCIPVKSKSMRKTLDADKEEWDILDDKNNSNHHHTARRRSSVKPKVEQRNHATTTNSTSSYCSSAYTHQSSSIEEERKHPASINVPTMNSSPHQGIRNGLALDNNNATDYSVDETKENVYDRKRRSVSKQPKNTYKLSNSSIASDNDDVNSSSKRRRISSNEQTITESQNDKQPQATHQTENPTTPVKIKREEKPHTISSKAEEQSEPSDESDSSSLVDTESKDVDTSSDETVETITTDTYTESATYASSSDDDDDDDEGSVSERSALGLRRSNRRLEKSTIPTTRPRRAVAPTSFANEQEQVETRDEMKSTPRRSNRRDSFRPASDVKCR